ncbi:glycerol kinase GlpK [Facklamia miroungae]|uniref:glycerol kinase n=1 Tax=Facklamia miroungae TaxID=120956 RepID=A0A1G7QCV1_9LACT|nr:glycerol kinase GlpK [Facklamia miroungae]NKZ28903.1 glycerol kinase GlpK [Facklamia miroungae]SDF96343.1 glycerol kinase [Facklamia miroungae]
MAEYILSIDQGTTTTRAFIIDRKGNYIGTASQKFQQISPHTGWVEHDPNVIWETVCNVIEEVIQKSGINYSQIKALGLTNQRETTVVWDKITGEPIYNAIVWSSNQSLDTINQLKSSKNEEYIHKNTGLVMSPYFSASKIRWILDHYSGAQIKAEGGKLLFGTIDSWIIWKLTNGALHVTDHTNASRTMLFNIHSLEWDNQLLKLFNIPKAMLPNVFPSSHYYGETNCDLFQGVKIPITGVAGNQQASLFGQLAFQSGQVKSTYGQGTFIVMNTGSEAKLSNHRLLTTIAYSIDDQINYALEGAALISGSAIEWLKDGLELFEKIEDSEELALEANQKSSVYSLPTFRGIGAPYWETNVRGAILGMDEYTSKRELILATFESLAYQVHDIIDLMESDTEIELDVLHVDGGVAQNNLLIQFQADILNKKVVRVERLETTGLGAAYLAGLAVDYWKDLDELRALVSENEVFNPNMLEIDRIKKLRGWHNALKTVRYYSQLNQDSFL